VVGHSTRIPVLFIVNPEGAIGGPHAAVEWFDRVTNSIKNSLRECCGEVEFSYYYVRDVGDLREAISREVSAPGYLVFVLNCISGLLKPLIELRKPLVLINETYGSSGD